MSGIFGIFQRDASRVEQSDLEAMRSAMLHWGPDGCGLWHEDRAGLGHLNFASTPEASFERLPSVDAAGGFVFTAAGRVDNRLDLAHALGIPIHELSQIADGQLLQLAYSRWGECCPGRIFGDWAFVAWHPIGNRLFMARDQHGNTSLYYYVDPRRFAFASSRQALLALNLCPIELDELYLAQVLVSWPAYHGERTVHKPIRRLPPAHCLVVTAEQMHVRQYWKLEETPELKFRQRADYVAAFREVFDNAVGARLRSVTPVAATLSGGLDSGSVSVLAARYLRDRGQNLTAFTSVPLSDTSSFTGKQFGNELPFAQATAHIAGNIILHPIDAEDISPIQAIRHVLEIHDEPCHAVGNFFWLVKLEQEARKNGCKVLLTGQFGNSGISWTGDILSQSLSTQLHLLGWQGFVREQLRHAKALVAHQVPHELLLIAGRRRLEQRQWVRESAIHPDFANRLCLLDKLLSDPDRLPPRTPWEKRRFLKPGRSIGGALHAQMGAAHGVEVRDPTADARVLAFCFSVPDHIFIDPETGLDRWLIREAMKDHLPDKVRLNRRLGRQAGDLVPRLRSCATEVEEVLDDLTAGPAAAYLDVSYMRQVWRVVQTKDTQEAFYKSMTVLTRGIMAGMFINRFYAHR